MKLSFKEYYESKQSLLLACESVPRIRNEYKLTKYCKVPVFESLDNDDKTYVSFKPKDRIEVLWEGVDEFDDYPIVKHIVLISEGNRQVFPCWGSNKIHKWVENNTHEA